MDWSVDDAIREFIRLGEEAFAKRYFLKLPVFKSPAQLLYSYRYTSEGINSALQNAFGTGRLFGYNESTRLDRVMVGVVSSARSSTQPYLFTNYSRNSTGNGGYTRSPTRSSADMQQTTASSEKKIQTMK